MPTELNLVSLLSGFKADAAVFTTYTLSLAWFETYLLRPLERLGLRRAAVLADPLGIADSLRERLVNGPGVRYALEPMTAAGAFHAKVAILWADDRLLLAVGSGNLTLPGMQRNLEAWEVFVAGVEGVPEHRALTREVAEGAGRFVAGLRARLPREAWAGRLLGDARDALATHAARARSNPEVRWLDTLDGPIGPELVRLLPPPAGPRRLAVLSPFYDRHGRAAQHLADQLGAAHLDVFHTGGTTSFPVGPARAWRAPHVRTRALQAQLELAAPDEPTPSSPSRAKAAPKPQLRPLHAKLLEVGDAGGTWVLSGSANATWRALWTTDNVEAGVLRRRDTPTLKGPEAEPTHHEGGEPEGEGARLYVASARASVKVHVTLGWRGDTPPAAVTIGWIDEPDTHAVAWGGGPRVEVDLPLPAAFDELRPRPLRVQVLAEVEGARVEARGWVSFDGWLDAAPAFRIVANAWTRLVEGGSPDEDDATLLRMFAEEHARTVAVVGEGRTKPASQGDKAREDQPIPLALLDALSRQGAALAAVPNTHDRGGPVDHVRHAMVAAFRALDRALPALHGGEDGEVLERPPLDRSVREALDQFEETVLAECARANTDVKDPHAALQYVVFCARLVLRYRAADGGEQALFWRSVDRLTRAVLSPRPPRGPLLARLSTAVDATVANTLATLLALLVWRRGALEAAARDAPRSTGGGTPDVRELLGAGALREALATLDRLARVDAPELPPALLEPVQAPPLGPVLASLRATTAPSARMRALKRAVYAVDKGVALPDDAWTDDERSLLGEVRHKRYPRFVTPWIEVCPGCHQDMSKVVRRQLSIYTLVRCTNLQCRRWLVSSEVT